MCIEDEVEARRILERVNYYRLSGYWYSYRQPPSDGSQRLDTFVEGTSFAEVVSLYEFDERLRAGVFMCLTPIELAVRSKLGHELGRIDPLIHLRPELLGPVAREPKSATEPSYKYKKWKRLYEKECPFRGKILSHTTRTSTRGSYQYGPLSKLSTGVRCHTFTSSPPSMCATLSPIESA